MLAVAAASESGLLAHLPADFVSSDSKPFTGQHGGSGPGGSGPLRSMFRSCLGDADADGCAADGSFLDLNMNVIGDCSAERPQHLLHASSTSELASPCGDAGSAGNAQFKNSKVRMWRSPLFKC